MKKDFEEPTIVSIHERKKSIKQNKRMNDPISRVLKANDKAFKFQRAMNDLLLKILDRYEMDKPILMADKLDIIWDKTGKKSDKPMTTVGVDKCDPDVEFDKALAESKLTAKELQNKK